MTVRVGRMTFTDWVALQYYGQYTDTFIFHIDAMCGLPPFEYRNLLQRLAAYLNKKRHGASLWVQVSSPGKWYLMEIKRSLLLEMGLSIPYAITPTGYIPQWIEFSCPPTLRYSAPPQPPSVEEKHIRVSKDELKCIQVLARIHVGHEVEISALAGLSQSTCIYTLVSLMEKKFVNRIRVDKDPFKEKIKPKLSRASYWRLTRKGLSFAMRSWGVPIGVEFTDRKEPSPKHAWTSHRQISRRWADWLRSAYSYAEIWTGWSEVRLPDTAVIPDGLAWGKIQGFETLFWLEVGDEHKNMQMIETITKTRLLAALRFCQTTGVRLVYAQLSPDWVKKIVRLGLVKVPDDTAVVMGKIRQFGRLPIVEWGHITGE